MLNTWIVLLPPLLVVILASTTRRVIPSILTGIFAGLLITNNYHPLKAGCAMIARTWKTTQLETINSLPSFWAANYLLICLFLLVLSILTVVLHLSGGAYAYSRSVEKYLKNKKHVEIATMILSTLFFIDDYFNCLTVGPVMRSVTDKFKISRAKLALIINSLAVPLPVLFPVSSWVADIIGQFKIAGISNVAQAETIFLAVPFFAYLSIIPFLFYPLICIISLWYLVVSRSSYGTIRKHEAIAEQTGNLFAGKKPVTQRLKELSPETIQHSALADFCIPIGFLFVSTFIFILSFGGYHIFGGSKSFVTALQQSNIAAALFLGSLITLIGSVLFLLPRKKITLQELYQAIIEGTQLMGPSIFALILVWTFSVLIRDLGTGHYLASFLGNNMNIKFLPALFFCIAFITSTAMGSAWGTIGILISIGIQMLVTMSHAHPPVTIANIPMILPMLGSIISGSLVGNHFSPISDTMIMSSASASAYHIDLAKSQFEFALPCTISTAIAFLVAGFLTPLFSIFTTIVFSLLIGLGCNIIFFKALQTISNKRFDPNIASSIKKE